MSNAISPHNSGINFLREWYKPGIRLAASGSGGFNGSFVWSNVGMKPVGIEVENFQSMTEYVILQFTNSTTATITAVEFSFTFYTTDPSLLHPVTSFTSQTQGTDFIAGWASITNSDLKAAWDAEGRTGDFYNSYVYIKYTLSTTARGQRASYGFMGLNIQGHNSIISSSTAGVTNDTTITTTLDTVDNANVLVSCHMVASYPQFTESGSLSSALVVDDYFVKYQSIYAYLSGAGFARTGRVGIGQAGHSFTYTSTISGRMVIFAWCFGPTPNWPGS
jgi:hypothetical protein